MLIHLIQIISFHWQPTRLLPRLVQAIRRTALVSNILHRFDFDQLVSFVHFCFRQAYTHLHRVPQRHQDRLIGRHHNGAEPGRPARPRLQRQRAEQRDLKPVQLGGDRRTQGPQVAQPNGRIDVYRPGDPGSGRAAGTLCNWARNTLRGWYICLRLACAACRALPLLQAREASGGLWPSLS